MDQTPADSASIDELRAEIETLREDQRRLAHVERTLGDAQERARRREHQLALLSASAQALRGAPDLDAIARIAARHAIDAMPADVALVALRPQPQGDAVLSTAVAADDEAEVERMDADALGIFNPEAQPELSTPRVLFDRHSVEHDALRTLMSRAVERCGADADAIHALVLPFTRLDGPLYGVLLALAGGAPDDGNDDDGNDDGDHGGDSDGDDVGGGDGGAVRDLPLFTAFAAHVERALDELAATDPERRPPESSLQLRERIEALENELKARDRIQAQLIVARDGAEDRARAKTNFLASMSHEIRTPLNGIVGTVELLHAETTSRTQRQRLDVLRSCVSSLQILVGDILDFSRIEAGYLSLDLRPFLLGDLLEGTYQSLLFQRRSPRVGFEVVLGDGVPDVVIGDPDRLGQVLGNLCDNALKFTARGQIVLRARVSEHSINVYDDEVTIRFEVEDTGIGMAPEQMERVFQPFRQAEPTTSHTYGGTGLGLAICKQLVEAMGGAIGVTSTLGIGSRFWFTLPLEVGSEKDLSESSHDHHLPESNNAAPRVLLVDDNQINQKVAASLLERLGCQTQVASNGIEAVAVARTRLFDLIFMDCQMPHMDGYQAATEIRRIPSHVATPIIALTAYASQDDRARCLECGMNDYVAKPVTTKRLRDILVRWANMDLDAPG